MCPSALALALYESLRGRDQILQNFLVQVSKTKSPTTVLSKCSKILSKLIGVYKTVVCPVWGSCRHLAAQ